MGARSARAVSRREPSRSRPINNAASWAKFHVPGCRVFLLFRISGHRDRTGVSRLRRPLVQRRQFIAGAAGLIAGSLAPRLAMADVPTPFTFDMAPPMDNREKFVAWGVAQRGEDPKFLGERFDRFGAMVRNEDLVNDRNKHAFLLTPREKFVLQQNLGRAYDHAFLDIGYGVTISGPHIVGRMTSNIDPKLGERVLEIGTGSGYQSAYLSHLTDQGLHDRDHQAARRAHAVDLRPAHQGRLQGVRGHQEQGRRRLLRVGRGGAVRQDHRHLRHRPRSSAAAAAAEAGRDHGHSGRAAGRAARVEGRQDAKAPTAR